MFGKKILNILVRGIFESKRQYAIERWRKLNKSSL
jgi:hypothetical protein